MIRGITGALVGMGIPEYRSETLRRCIKDGGNILLSVHCDDSKMDEEGKKIVDEAGADVSSTGEAGADFRKTD